MKNIRKYSEFTNEEINMKKTLAGVALGAGLAFGNPTIGNTQKNVKTPQKTTQNKQVLNNDINGWGKVKWGMTRDQVKKIYGNSESSDTLDVLGSSGISNSMGVKFKVEFKYTDNKLSSVQLGQLISLDKYEYFKIESYNSLVSELEQKLVEKYGKPDYNNLTDNRDKMQTANPNYSQTLYELNSSINKTYGKVDLFYKVQISTFSWWEKLGYTQHVDFIYKSDSEKMKIMKQNGNYDVRIFVTYSDKRQIKYKPDGL
jgi:hypothetical protein